MESKNNQDNKTINIGVPVDKELFDMVQQQSKKLRISKASLVRMVLAKYFNQKGEF